MDDTKMIVMVGSSTHHSISLEAMRTLIEEAITNSDKDKIILDLPSDSCDKISQKIVLLRGDLLNNRDELVKILAESGTVVSEPLSFIESETRLAEMITNLSSREKYPIPYLPDVPERDSHWYNQYDFRGKKKHRKYT